jgi:2-polyprenyl-3-methyl-5-hydroxy-6-metoxy-1,4-benzoquinol methylase
MIKKYLWHLIQTAEENYLKNIFKEISHLNLETFLDIGCYYGDNTIQAAKAIKAKRVYGIELNDEASKKAIEKGIEILKIDINQEDWSISDASIDFIYSNQVIEHLYSVDNFIINIKRILSDTGYALISTENLAGWHNVASLALGFQPFSTANICTKRWSIGNPFSQVPDGHHDPLMIHRAVFTHYALGKFLEAYGFKIEKEINAGYYPLPNNKIGNFFARMDRKHSVYTAYLIKK